MTILVDDVRIYLKNMPEDFVSDETIERHIDMAEWVIDHEKSAAATATDLDMAVLLRACYGTIIAYMSEAERSLGVLPPSLIALSQQLEFDAAIALTYIRRGTPISLRLFDVSGSLWAYATGATETDLNAQDVDE